MSAALSIIGPIAAVAAAAVTLVTWYVSDRRKSAAETTVAEASVQADIDKRDVDAREARLLYVEKQMDIERNFHQQQLSDRDAEIIRQRAELSRRDARIAALVEQVTSLQTQLEDVTRQMTSVRTQLDDLVRDEPNRPMGGRA